MALRVKGAMRLALPGMLLIAACTTTGADGSNMGATVTEQPGTTAASVIELLVPYMQGHPETLEGNPSTTLTITKSGEGLVAKIRQMGFLDDAVLGEEIEARIARAQTGGWQLTEVARTPLCRRGVSDDGLCL